MAGEVDVLRQAGFSEDEVKAHVAPQVEALQAAGFSQDEIGKHLGVKPVNHDSAQKSLARRVYDNLAATAKNTANALLGVGDKALAASETAAHVVTGFGAGFPAYLAGGIGGLIARNTYSPDTDPKVIATMFAEAVTYNPRSDSGKSMADTATYPFQLLAEFKEKQGKAVADKTGSAALAAITDETIGMLPFVFIGSLARSLKGRAPDNSEFRTTAEDMTAKPERVPDTVATREAEIKAVESRVQDIYEKTGVDPQALKEAAARDPTVLEDLVSSNIDVPRAFPGEAPFSDRPSVASESRRAAEIKAEIEARKRDAEQRKAKEDADRKARLDAIAEEAAAAKTAEGAGGGSQPPGPTAGIPFEAARDAVSARISVGQYIAREFTWQKFYTAVKDDLYPIAVIEAQLHKGVPLEVAESPYKLAREVRGAAGKATMFLDHGTFDFNTYRTTGPGLKQILKPVENDLAGFRAYAVARRAEELHARGIETGVPAAEAAVVAKAGAKYEKTFSDLQSYQTSLVQYLKDSGLIGEEAFVAMMEANKDYVPFFRHFDEPRGKQAGAGLRTYNPIKAIKGSERLIVDPIESIIKNTYLYTALAERNAVGQAFGKLVLQDKVAAADLGVSVVKPKTKPITVTAEELARQGIDAEAFAVFRPDAMRPAPNQIRYYENGKAVTLEVPKEVAEAFKATDRESVGLLLKMVALPASTLRAGAILSPDFIARNPFRDQYEAFINSKTGYVPFYDLVRGAMSYAKKDADFQNWLKSGGANSALVSLDRAYLQQHLAQLNKDAGLFQKSWNVVTSPVEMLRITSELMENATRLGEFKRAKAYTKAEIQAAGFESREVTLDFQRIGAQTRGLNMIAAFWNAQVEGMDRSFRAVKDNPLGTTARLAAGITAPSILLWYANNSTPERQERWREVPNWQRDIFWIVMTDEHTYRIPKPHAYGIIFGSAPERMLDQFAADKPDAMKDFMTSVGGMFTANILPTGAVPLLEQMTNHSFFTNNPLIPSRMEGILPEYQYQEYTTQASRALGQIVGAFPGLHDKSIASPIVIDNYIRGWTGGLGAYARDILDLDLRKLGILPDPPQPMATLADIPVVKAFVVRYPSATAQSVQDFYDNHAKRRKVYETFQYLVKNGDPEAAEKEAKLDPTAFARLDGVSASLRELNANIRMVHRNPEMTPIDKRQLIDSMYGMMVEMAREGNRAMRLVDEALKPAE